MDRILDKAIVEQRNAANFEGWLVESVTPATVRTS